MATVRPRKPHPGSNTAPAAEPTAADAGADTKALDAQKGEMIARLDNLGQALAVKRSDAIQARSESGIEQDWMEDEEFYQGIDDANRDDHSRAWQTRPAGMAEKKRVKKGQSTLFVNITRPYVNAAAAKVSDILMPTDKGAFSLLPRPVPELIDTAAGKLSQKFQSEIAAKFPGQPAPAADAAEQAVRQAIEVAREAKEKADKAQKRIEDWHVECQYHGQMRLVIKDAARIGTGAMKGPVPVKRQQVAVKDGAAIINEEFKPASVRISAWNVFPERGCGENIHDGSCLFERDTITAKGLRKLKGTEGYIDSQIDLVIDEGPTRAIAPAKVGEPLTTKDSGPYEIWYFYGELDREDMLAAGCDCGEKTVAIPALVTVVNNRVIRASLNPLDSGDFPIDLMPWPQVRAGMPWGTGVARAGRTGQRIVTAGWRAMMDNAGAASGPQVIRGTQVQPVNGIDGVEPWKEYRFAEDGDIDDVRKAFAYIEAPMRQKELAEIIRMGMKVMEDETGLPMLLQGQQGDAPDLVGVVQILNTNAGAFLRDLARTFDDYMTEPQARRYYAWLLQYGKDDEKGEFVLDARGSSTNVERALQDQELIRMVQMALNPAYGLDPKKTMEEYLSSRHFDAKKFQFDDEKRQQIVANMAKGPQDQRLAVAQLRARVDEKLQAMEQQFDSVENEKDRQNKLAVAVIDERMNSTELTSGERETLAKIKASLAETAIKVRAQRDLSAESVRDGVNRHGTDIAVDLHKHHNPSPVLTPPSEPAGRAQPGQAFQA
jgi:hypothetical protein